MKNAMKLGLLALIASAGLLAGACPAHAEPHGWRNGGPKYNYHDHRYRGYQDNRYRGRPVTVTKWAPPRHYIRDHDRIVIRNYVQRSWRPLPAAYGPRYLIGAPLAYGVPYYAVPHNVLVQLAPVPYGYRYVRVDDDVLLLDAAANVIDAVARLSR